MEIDNYDYVVGYGIGQYYEQIKSKIGEKFKLNYVCDRRWEESNDKEYDNIPIIRKNDLLTLENVIVIVFSGSPRIYESIQRDMQKMKITNIHVDEIIMRKREITSSELKTQYPSGIYEDAYNNRIFFHESIPDGIHVSFQGENNVLKLEEDIMAGSLYIRYGNNGVCRIGKNTEILGGEIYVADAMVTIGTDCLFSTEVILRTHDSHHIFDLNTHQRINFPKDIEVGNNVWLAHKVTLLGGAKIGAGSVVGTNSVTSGQFGEHQVIVGVPARKIRENICWSKDNTEYFNHKSLKECVSKDALKYL